MRSRNCFKQHVAKGFASGTLLIVVDKFDDNVFLSSRNLPDVLVLTSPAAAVCAAGAKWDSVDKRLELEPVVTAGSRTKPSSASWLGPGHTVTDTSVPRLAPERPSRITERAKLAA